MDFTLRQNLGQPKRCFFYGCAKVAQREIRAGGAIYPICEDCLNYLDKCLKTNIRKKQKHAENVDNEV